MLTYQAVIAKDTSSSASVVAFFSLSPMRTALIATVQSPKSRVLFTRAVHVHVDVDGNANVNVKVSVTVRATRSALRRPTMSNLQS